jgi:hypothetical protein
LYCSTNPSTAACATTTGKIERFHLTLRRELGIRRRRICGLHVVQHGIDANNNDKYDVEALGVSTFAESWECLM